MGLSISSAISIFVNKVVNVGGIPYLFNIAKKTANLVLVTASIILITKNLID